MDGMSAILVVDDDPATRHLLEAVFRRKNFNVESVADGAEALARLGHREYVAILLDLMMPGVDGFEVIRHVSETMPHLLKRIIVITAVCTAAVTRLENQLVVGALLRKPFDLDDLLRSVLECIRAASAEIPAAKLVEKVR